MSAESLRTLIADRGDAATRLDHMVRRHLAGAESATRTQIQGWIEDGRVRVNDAVVRRVAARTAIGDVVTIDLPASAQRLVMVAEPVALDLLHEDDDLLVLNKPAGVVVHPTYKHAHQTIMNGLLWHGRDWSDGHRPSIVGRLDKQTSGLVVVAKSAAMHATLQHVLTGRDSRKDYLAIVHGRVPHEPFTIDLKLARDPDDRRRVVASTTRGVESRTVVSRVAETQVANAPVTVVRCRLLTGRMHQIRVHLAASGWPIGGDTKYGQPLYGFERQALHSHRLSFVHPRTGVRLDVEAPFPTDFQAFLDAHFAEREP